MQQLPLGVGRSIALVAVCGGLAGAAAWVWDRPRFAGATPVAIAASAEAGRTFDLPPVVYDPQESAPREFEFPIRNTTPHPVRFSEVRTSCGCTDAALEKMELAPGEETQLRGEIHLEGVAGTRSVSIQLLAETGLHWEYQLRVPCRPRVTFKPFETVFGVLEPGAASERDVVVNTYAVAGQEPPAVEVRSPHPDVDVRVAGERVQSDNEFTRRETRVSIQLHCRGEGAFRGELVAECDGVAGSERVEAKHGLVWKVRPKLKSE